MHSSTINPTALMIRVEPRQVNKRPIDSTAMRAGLATNWSAVFWSALVVAGFILSAWLWTAVITTPDKPMQMHHAVHLPAPRSNPLVQ